jgi:pyridoxal phosphate enzyme (YggS family)
MFVVEKYNYISSSIHALSSKTTLVVVTKNQDVDKINSLINLNHIDFGENRVQEATQKWKSLILNNSKLRLHLIGKLQSNKAKDAFDIFNYIHTLDNAKLAKIFSNLESTSLKKIKYFIQVNIANEQQKNGISIAETNQFIKYCIQDLKLNIIGLMCIPPIVGDPSQYFKSLAKIAISNNLKELSMGMSNDYECAIKNGATFVRIGSKIFSSD